MQKKSLLALLLALTLVLSGCALVTVDQEKDNARVIVDVNGETVNKQTIAAAVQNELQMNQYYNQLASSMGISANYSTDEATVTSNVISSYVNQLVAKQKAAELGLNEMNEEDQAAIETDAKQMYDSFISSVTSTYFVGTELEGDELTQAAEKYVADNAIATADGRSTLADFTKTATDNRAIEKLQEYAVKDVSVSDEEINAEFDSKVEADKESFEANPDTYGYNLMNGTETYYAPAGYRMVKHILVPFDTENTSAETAAQTALTAAQSALTEAQAAFDGAGEDADKEALQTALTQAEEAVSAAQADFDAANSKKLADAKEKADEIYALATAEGADFDALIAEYSTDNMPEEGYAIREGFAYFVTPFVEGAMALEKAGDVSGPIESTYGYHIIQYVSDVQEGPVDLETVREAISADLKTVKENEALAAATAQWLEAANVKTYPDRMN